ncbi:MAG: nitroreductase family deazaflavin-dependent oxidoreductase [Anaerolineales bacterium]|nr:nitroreductase family deazaflavin-dependent oxidoreductase [Anaerolineales bacterium]
MMNKGITANQPKGFLRFLFRLPLWLYRVKLGWLLDKRFLMLTHIGRKSGQPREVVLEVVHDDSETGVYFVAAGWRGKADWFKNIQSNPEVQVMVGSRTFKAKAAVVQLAEAASIFYLYARRHPFAFRELSRLMMGEMLQPVQRDCFLFANSVPLVKLIPCLSLREDIKNEGRNNG